MKKRNNYWQAVIIYGFICLALIIVDHFGWFNGLRLMTQKVANPVKIGLFQIFQKSQNIFLIKKEKKEDWLGFSQQLENLEIENLGLKADLEKLTEENKQMRRLLSAPLAPDLKFLPAKVIGVEQQIIDLDKGSNNKLKVGDLVVVENILVGKIMSVFPLSSKVMLVDHPDFSLSVWIAKNETSGLVKVSGNRVFLDEVVQGIEISKDSLVVDKENNLVLGKVGQKISQDKDKLQKFEIVWPIKPESLRTVFVLIK